MANQNSNDVWMLACVTCNPEPTSSQGQMAFWTEAEVQRNPLEGETMIDNAIQFMLASGYELFKVTCSQNSFDTNQHPWFKARMSQTPDAGSGSCFSKPADHKTANPFTPVPQSTNLAS